MDREPTVTNKSLSEVLCLSRGSVIPKAICWSLPCAAATVLLHLHWGVLKGEENQELEGLGQIWSSFTFVFGFLIVFRSLAERGNRQQTETVLLWIERLILDADRDKTLDVPAPILSRAFQELSRGMVSVTDLRKIRDVPFPFPYSQFLSLMLLAHWVLTPIVASQVIAKPYWAGIIVFVVSTAYWTLFYIAQEIDQPFGDDSNDLPVADMQREFNAKLEYFCLPMASQVPNVKMDTDYRLLVLDSGYGDIDARFVEEVFQIPKPRTPTVI
ncbi:unnamed protein product [Symbiodinium sp. CCMP2592]|nr:unnamed protein product [Symbiodinium sp. CCMP2592]